VHRDRRGSNPIINLNLNLSGLGGDIFGLSAYPRDIVHTFLRVLYGCRIENLTQQEEPKSTVCRPGLSNTANKFSLILHCYTVYR